METYLFGKLEQWVLQQPKSLSELLRPFPSQFSYKILKYPSNDFLDYTIPLRTLFYVGSVNRDVRYTGKSTTDFFFASFLQQQYGYELKNQKYARGMPEHANGYISIKKYDRSQPAIQLDDWNASLHAAVRHWQPFVGESEEISWEYEIQSLNKQTSPGAPWVNRYRTKHQALKDESILKFIGQSWTLSAKERLNLLFQYQNKEEVRSKEKIEQKNLRGFTASDITLVMCCDRLNRNINEKFYTSVYFTFNCVGICKYFRGWERLYRKLNVHPNAFELDESSWDASVFRLAMFEMATWRFMMLKNQTKENWSRMKHFYYDIVDSYIILTHGEVVQKTTGNPSGSPNTIVDNTIVLFRIFYYAWLQCHKQYWQVPMQYTPANYSNFIRNVAAALGGDDNTFTVSDRVVPWFNARNISEIWKGLGIKTHAPHDEGNLEFEPRRLEECHFFSMGFGLYRGVHVPVPDREKMYASMLFAGRGCGTAIWSLLRAYAIRIETFFDEEMRHRIAAFIQYLLRQKSVELESSVEPTLAQVQTIYKTDSEIIALYTGSESHPVNEKIATPSEKSCCVWPFLEQSFGTNLVCDELNSFAELKRCLRSES